jgi:hypothetical protein
MDSNTMRTCWICSYNQTSALLSNNGTVTGSGFGLSSGGEVIVYTGSNTTSPITALSSNGWITTILLVVEVYLIFQAGFNDGISSKYNYPGNTAGNTVNAFYSGTQVGTPSQLRTSILNPATDRCCWRNCCSNTTWNFPFLQVICICFKQHNNSGNVQ